MTERSESEVQRLAQAGSDISLGGSGSSLALNRAAFRTDMEERFSRIRRSSLPSLASLDESEEERWLKLCSYQSSQYGSKWEGPTSSLEQDIHRHIGRILEFAFTFLVQSSMITVVFGSPFAR